MSISQSSAASASANIGKVLQHCPVCRSDYLQTHMQVIDQQDGVDLMHCLCHTCESSLLAVVSKTELGVSIIAILTDLTYDDSLRLIGTDPVSEDDLLAMHHMLTHKQEQLFHYLTIE